MHIRPATSEDLAALCAFDSVASERMERREAIAAWVAEGVCKLADVDGRPAAYAVANQHFFGTTFIEMLMVDRRVRGRGIGFALVNHFKETCTGPKLFSSTNLSNRPMQNLLLKAGFKSSGYIDNIDKHDPELVFFYAVR